MIAKFAIEHEAAMDCVAVVTELADNAIVCSTFASNKVPAASDHPDRIWRKKLKMELTESLALTGVGLPGTGILTLAVLSFPQGRMPQERVGTILVAVLLAVMGPFLLLVGVRLLLRCLWRWRRFSALDRRGNLEGINQLIAELYDIESESG